MKVQVVSMEGCSGCEVVKKSLEMSNIPYEVVDFFQNEELVNKYHVRTLPTTILTAGLVATTVPGSRPQDIAKIKELYEGAV